MRIAVFGKQFGEVFFNACKSLFNILKDNNVDVVIHKPFYDFLLTSVKMKPEVDAFFTHHDDIADVDLVFSIGGDGTFLEAVTYVRDKGIPIVGINSGRLGFLADISQGEMKVALREVLDGKYRLRQLDLLVLETNGNHFGDYNFALNELAISKRDSSAMITIHTYVNNEFLNSFWADGLIISTTTGSTAYSLSVGGPILHPDSKCLIITPIAPHNLNVRPVVVPNDVEVTLKVEGRDSKFLASLDSRSEVFDNSVNLKVKKAGFSINVIELDGHSFFTTLRNKLMWGVDKRN
ncbi:NAD kinase [Carboxylicivirga mesophila]|uniref:NAD kinase n=1 Tax=Carboxylicivirga mesophila TaxID=1166478 RepID=A0ABS5KAU5_9BACT|nr:NAD kinase [Carboxylicivirga mesophila]MBS2211628.1 NAD kinase [Carboxylicivirga mesophila]